MYICNIDILRAHSYITTILIISEFYKLSYKLEYASKILMHEITEINDI